MSPITLCYGAAAPVSTAKRGMGEGLGRVGRMGRGENGAEYGVLENGRETESWGETEWLLEKLGRLVWGERLEDLNDSETGRTVWILGVLARTREL